MPLRSAPCFVSLAFVNPGAGRGRRVALAMILPLLFLGCKARSDQHTSAERQTGTSVESTRGQAAEPDSTAELRCQDLRAKTESSEAQAARVIELHPPKPGKRLVLSKTGVIVRFSRDDFLKAARCLNLEKAAEYIETQSGDAAESPLPDAFQLSYVAAALLDVGRAGVRLREETTSRASIVRGQWSAEGCAGRCRSFGRIYRLSASDSAFFLRITDRTENQRN